MKKVQWQWRNPAAGLSTAIIIGGAACGLLNYYEGREYVAFVVLAAILSLFFYINITILQEKKTINPKVWWIPGVGCLFSIVFLCNPYSVSHYPIWILGVAVVAAYIDASLGLILTFGLALLKASLSAWSMNDLLIPIVLAAFLCLTVKLLSGIKQMIYLILLQLSMNVTMLLLLNGFELSILVETRSWLILWTNLLVTMFLAILIRFKPLAEPECIKPFIPVTEESESTKVEIQDQSAEKTQTKEPQTEKLQTEELQESESKRKQLQNATQPDAKLLVRMKSESPKLYHHSEMVAKMAKDAAMVIDADDILTYAGGWYHEIGRLTGNDYIANGIELIKEEGLPSELQNMVSQHTYKNESPKSKEAAVLLLTDNLIATITYLKNNPETKIPSEKIVDNTFSLLLNKGAFDDAGLELTDFIKLKNYYKERIQELL